ncbi:FAD-binding domain-containing protein [Xylaria acuta]|nr:FAD-binding domain-containing protein [Xylaria acuta]
MSGRINCLRFCETQPAAIFRPRSADGVSTFVRTIRAFALSGQAPFAIFGVGQQPALGSRPLGLSVAGGRSARNGIGGLALQGGLSLFSSREAFIADNIVLAPGNIVDANAKDHPDLWRILRGGGNNFGVVTRFDLRTFKQGPLHGGSIYCFPPSFPSEIQALVTELQKPNATPETHLMISVGFAAVYYTQAVDKPEVSELFTSTQPQIDQLNALRLTPNVTEAANEQAGDQQLAKRAAYMNATVKADIATLRAAADIYTAVMDPVESTEGLICSLTLQPYAEPLLQRSAAKGGDVLGPKHKLGGDDAILGAMKTALQGIDQDATFKGTKVDYVYMNYASEGQDIIGL